MAAAHSRIGSEFCWNHNNRDGGKTNSVDIFSVAVLNENREECMNMDNAVDVFR